MATSIVSTGGQELAGYQGVQPACVGQTLNSTLSTSSSPEFERDLPGHPGQTVLLCCLVRVGVNSPGEESWTTSMVINHSFAGKYRIFQGTF